ncbi:MAG: hypothetical protein L0177_19810 [Chloroflexi bacterium]|nr:hypothetical protein [Chloroflexota bacterium]
MSKRALIFEYESDEPLYLRERLKLGEDGVAVMKWFLDELLKADARYTVSGRVISPFIDQTPLCRNGAGDGI